MKKLFKCTEIHVQDLANGKDIAVFNSYKDFNKYFPSEYYIVEFEVIGSKALADVRLHDKASLAKLYITE